MGILTKILDRSPPLVGAKPIKPLDTGSPAATSPAAPFLPCMACGSPAFWVDVYGNPPHCRNCDPPSSDSLVKYFAWVVGTPGETQLEKNPRNRTGDDGSVGEEEFQYFVIGNPGHSVSGTAIRGRANQARMAGPSGRYSPPLPWGPVGDMAIDEWIDRVEVPWPTPA